MSDGWLFIILLFVGILVYVGGGIGYNVKYKAMQPGIEAIPFIEYWKEVCAPIRLSRERAPLMARLGQHEKKRSGRREHTAPRPRARAHS